MLHFLWEFVSFLPWGKNYYRNRLKLLMSLPHAGMEVTEIFGVAAATLSIALAISNLVEVSAYPRGCLITSFIQIPQIVFVI